MEFLNHLAMAFSVALEPINLFSCFIGVLIGTLVGVLPGLGPAASMSLLLPITFNLSAVQAIIMLAGIYYGTMYGGSTTSILVNIPGEAASVVTTLDGYQMARKGRAGPALGISAIGSFIGGTFGIIMMMLIAPSVVKFALRFGPPEFFALALFGLTMVSYLSSGSVVRALMMALVGLLLAYIGMDIISGKQRFTFGFSDFSSGLSIVPVIMGLFGISEVLINLERSFSSHEIFRTNFKNILPSKKDFKDCTGPITRGSILGFFLGIIPGGGGLLSSFVSYALEKKIAKNPENFGKGDIRGVAGPETANNAGAQGTFIPLMTLGIPCNVVLAILLGALMIHGVTPGPRLMTDEPQLFWGIIGSMYLGNAMLLILNLPLVGLWVKILKIPYRYLFPSILLFCLIGSYTIGNNVQDVFLMIIFGLFGYLMRKFKYDPAPLVLAMVLGPIFEQAFRQSLIISRGSFLIFITRPISAFFLGISFIFLFSPLFMRLIRKKSLRKFLEEEN